MRRNYLPIPPHFDSEKVAQVWRVPYQQRAEDARKWAKQNKVPPAANDKLKICLLLIDVQNTFCIPKFELFVGGRSGIGAVDDNRRLCEFIYRNLDIITQICPTMDTHQAIQIFHAIFFVNQDGEHPEPFTLVSAKDVETDVWEVNPGVIKSLNIDSSYSKEFLKHYTRFLRQEDKYNLTIWPYHAMLGGIGHALVSAVEEAIFFHTIARYSPPDFQVAGDNPLTENYSAIKPEVMHDFAGNQIAEKNSCLIEKLFKYDALFIAGQAKSHCVAWTIDDLLKEIRAVDSSLTEKIYVLEDCMSPVVIPNVIDYTDTAEEAFQRFSEEGLHVIRSTEPLESLPGIKF
jgi:nicotinamidase-related amidase